jgi:hypothetical protein
MILNRQVVRRRLSLRDQRLQWSHSPACPFDRVVATCHDLRVTISLTRRRETSRPESQRERTASRPSRSLIRGGDARLLPRAAPSGPRCVYRPDAVPSSSSERSPRGVDPGSPDPVFWDWTLVFGVIAGRILGSSCAGRILETHRFTAALSTSLPPSLPPSMASPRRDAPPTRPWHRISPRRGERVGRRPNYGGPLLARGNEHEHVVGAGVDGDIAAISEDRLDGVSSP